MGLFSLLTPWDITLPLSLSSQNHHRYHHNHENHYYHRNHENHHNRLVRSGGVGVDLLRQLDGIGEGALKHADLIHDGRLPHSSSSSSLHHHDISDDDHNLRVRISQAEGFERMQVD